MEWFKNLRRRYAQCRPAWKLWGAELRSDTKGDSDPGASDLIALFTSVRGPEGQGSRAPELYLAQEMYVALPGMLSWIEDAKELLEAMPDGEEKARLLARLEGGAYGPA
jgi:hypothetical protein